MLRYLLLSASFFVSLTLFAQHTVSKDVVVSVSKSVRDQEVNLTYSANNSTSGKMTIVLSLEGRSFERADGSIPAVKELLPGTNRIISLTNVSRTPAYSYMWVSGCVDVEHDEVTYLLPVAPGKTTWMDTLKSIGEVFLGKEKSLDFISFSFKASPGDKIYASRRGTIIEMEDKYDAPTGEGISYQRQNNYVVIEHDDCTRGRYELFAKGGITAGFGKTVEAGDVLGTVVDGSAFTNGTHLRFSVYYTDLSRKQLIEKQKDRAKTYQRQYVSVAFTGANGPGEVICTHPEEVIFQEMRKKDIKRWKKSRSN
ncbi:M23 family metallopeptidase [Neolewinella agarilytica]|uniref:Peptidase family M23 n=1 Tax=Neolewinella agarilytica TaxID=478744 RepID=A0A1H9MB73_9BACT|nr:M23 family metallopeptidase [Neolewinella agarilytica]SER20944.1 Peptidase family M23 [Neolewinella agarilytica]